MKRSFMALSVVMVGSILASCSSDEPTTMPSAGASGSASEHEAGAAGTSGDSTDGAAGEAGRDDGSAGAAGRAGEAGAPAAGSGDGGAAAAAGSSGNEGGSAGSGGARDCAANGSPAGPYVAETRTITSDGEARSFVFSRPSPTPAGLPLVFALHGDGVDGAAFRASLPLEAQAAGSALFVYPNAPGGSAFAYFDEAARAKEARLVQDLIASLDAELCLDEQRVFVVGFSGGAAMADALGCRLGPSVIRGLALHSYSLFAEESDGSDFTYTSRGGVSCALPDALLVWGQKDAIVVGQGVRDVYLATQACQQTTSAGAVSPCVAYDGCSRSVSWCAIPGLGHALWSEAASAIWQFVEAEK